MDKVDRLGWAAGVAFGWHGRKIGIRVNDPEMMDSVIQMVPPGVRKRPESGVDDLYSLWSPKRGRQGVRGFHMVFCDHQILERSLEAEPVIDRLKTSLSARIAVMARRRLFVRAGVVGWRGSVILITGSRQAGTSTLVSALVSKGADYYSD